MPFLKVNLAEMGVITPSLRHNLIFHRHSCEPIGLDAEHVFASGNADSANRSIARTDVLVDFACSGRLLSVKFTPDSTREASGVGFGIETPVANRNRL